jgi:hypothetical protein
MRIPTALKPYKMQVTSSKKPDAARMAPNETSAEPLTGMVMGQSASALEERAYRSIVKIPGVLAIEFQPSFLAGRGMPGEYRLDFQVTMPGYIQPIQIDGEWIHKSAEAREEDEVKDIQFDNEMMGTGALPVRRVNELEIPDQARSDQLLREILR